MYILNLAGTRACSRAFHASGWRARAWFVARGGSRARARVRDLAGGRGHKKVVSAGITPAAIFRSRGTVSLVAAGVSSLGLRGATALVAAALGRRLGIASGRRLTSGHHRPARRRKARRQEEGTRTGQKKKRIVFSQPVAVRISLKLPIFTVVKVRS